MKDQPKPTTCITCNTEFTGSFTGECPECEQKALQRFVSQPEWTEGMVFAYWESEDWQGLVDAHNAELAAERELRQDAELDLTRLNDTFAKSTRKLCEELAAEREKVHTFADVMKFIRDNANEGVIKAMATDALAKIGKHGSE